MENQDNNKSEKKDVDSTNAEQIPTQQIFRLSDQDILSLEISKNNRKLALEKSKTVLEEQKVAELSFKYLVLRLYMKYGLTDKDVIDENGNIIIGGAIEKQ